MSGRSDHSDRSRVKRIERLKLRLAAVAEDDAKTGVNDPMVPIMKGVLDLLADDALELTKGLDR